MLHVHLPVAPKRQLAAGAIAKSPEGHCYNSSAVRGLKLGRDSLACLAAIPVPT